MSTLKAPRRGAPRVAVTVSLATTVPSASRTSATKVASKTIAVPLTVTGLPTLSPTAGDSTKMAGSKPAQSRRRSAVVEHQSLAAQRVDLGAIQQEVARL